MSYTPALAEEILSLMAGLGRITNKKMFGELGYYSGSIIFACLIDDELYLKARGPFAAELLALGGKQFTYEGKGGKRVNMPYVTVPLACMEDADEMVTWCKRALVEADKAK